MVFVSDQEDNTAKYLQENSQDSSYIDLTVKDEEASDSVVDGSVEGQSDDPLYSEAVNIVVKSKKASISNLQRRLKVGYNRAALLIENMEVAGIVSEMNNNGSRTVLLESQD